MSPSRKREQFETLDYQKVEEGKVFEVTTKGMGAGWKGVHVKLIECYAWECRAEIIKQGKGISGNFRVGRRFWIDNRYLQRPKDNCVLVEHLRSLVSASRK